MEGVRSLSCLSLQEKFLVFLTWTVVLWSLLISLLKGVGAPVELLFPRIPINSFLPQSIASFNGMVLLLRWTSLLSSKGGCYFPFLFLSVIFHLNYADYPFFPVWLMLHTSDNHQLATSIPQQSVVLSCERELFLLPTSNFPLHTDDPHAILLWWYPSNIGFIIHSGEGQSHFPWDWSFLKWAGDHFPWNRVLPAIRE